MQQWQKLLASSPPTPIGSKELIEIDNSVSDDFPVLEEALCYSAGGHPNSHAASDGVTLTGHQFLARGVFALNVAVDMYASDMSV